MIEASLKPKHIIDEGEFLATLQAANPGQSVEYYRGFLFEDRADNPRLGDLANIAWREAEHGKVDLVQWRHGPKDYGYYAVKRREIRPWEWVINGESMIAGGIKGRGVVRRRRRKKPEGGEG